MKVLRDIMLIDFVGRELTLSLMLWGIIEEGLRIVMIEEIIFTRKDFNEFRRWINVDTDSATWHGEKATEFERFWFVIFIDGLSLGQLTDRFKFLIFEYEVGPLVPWFRWLLEKLICFVFIKKNITVYQLSQETELSLSQVSNILRIFFIDFYPHLQQYISNSFQMSNITDSNITTRYEDIKEKVSVDHKEFGTTKDEMMPSLEVTLYPEWKKCLSKFESNFLNPQLGLQKIKANISLKNQMCFFRDLVILFAIGLTILFLIEKGNKVYKKHLLDKISIYRPQFQLLDKTVPFAKGNNNDISNIPASVDNFDKQVNARSLASEDNKTKEIDERFETESEVILTSVDDLPKNFDAASMEGFSGQNIRGYRDSRHGTTKVYRVMMRSTDITRSKEKLEGMLGIYSASKVDNNDTKNYVPGGLYYNIYIPRNYIKEFLAQVMEMDEAVLYESRTKAEKNEPGKDRVFIWIKSLN